MCEKFEREVFFETQCCFCSLYFLHRENTLKALQLHNQKHKRRRSTGAKAKVFYMIERKQGGKRKEGDCGFPAVNRPPASHFVSFFKISVCFHFSMSWFKLFSSSTVGCKREIVHHIPHIL